MRSYVQLMVITAYSRWRGYAVRLIPAFGCKGVWLCAGYAVADLQSDSVANVHRVAPLHHPPPASNAS
jgi:hypothetical protein